ncbi:MAG: sugar phosphate isomerase/epimerase [Caldilineales bacterium]|nr:sugar phosphate isomerase/epimerase [Caldilineales bacterium]MCW5860566.1 sugar phosphate isomerase/epimerase [Caldilineales bacterium]
MKIGALGVIVGDLTDVDYNKIRWAAELGFHGLGAHITVPAESISDRTIANVKTAFADQGMALLQLWPLYPCIISPDEGVRQAGVEQARASVKLASKLGVPASGVRPTSLSPRGDWAPHPDNYKPETEDRFLRSLSDILQTADDYGIDIILEMHQTTLLKDAPTVRRLLDRVASPRLKVNIDPVNFVNSLAVAFDSAPMIHELFDLLGPFADTVHVKDFYLQDHFVLHISETVVGTGMMDIDTVLRRAEQAIPNGYVIVEHLPLALIPLARQNLAGRMKALGISIG